MRKKVMRFLIPADETEITVSMTGSLLFVTHTADGVVELYSEELVAEENDDADITAHYRTFRVFNNGETIPDYFGYAGSVTVGSKVRHVYEFLDGAAGWTPALTSDADAASVKNSDLPAWPKYDETDPGASR